jgi:hypothetical protein
VVAIAEILSNSHLEKWIFEDDNAFAWLIAKPGRRKMKLIEVIIRNMLA